MFKRVEKIDISKVRQMCIDYNFFTKGDAAKYENMFEMCERYTGDLNDLAWIALEIVDNTDEEELEDYGVENLQEKIAFIMTLLIRTCVNVDIRYER